MWQYLGQANEILPATSATTIATGFFSTVGDNIVPVVTLLGIMAGVTFVRSLLNRAKRGKI